MLTQRANVFKTKRGRVIRHITEHYLRDDIGCGLDSCSHCRREQTFSFPQLSTYPNNQSPFSIIKESAETLLKKESLPGIAASKIPSLQSPQISTYLNHLSTLLTQYELQGDTPLVLIPETNIFLQQFDFLETQTIPFANMLVLQSSLQFLQRKHYKIYQKLRSLCTKTTFQSSSLLKSNFESKSFSIANSSQESTITPHLYVFGDLHHRQVYSNAIEELGEICEDLLLPFEQNLPEHQHFLDDQDEINLSLFGGAGSFNDIYDDELESETEPVGRASHQDQPSIAIPSSFVQFIDLEIDPDRPESGITSDGGSSSSSSSSSSSTAALNNEQSYELQYLSTLFSAANKWYHRHQKNTTCVLGLTSDLATALKHVELGIPSIPIDLYIAMFTKQHPGFESLLAMTQEEQVTRDRSKWVYSEHLSAAQIESGVQSGTIFVGKLNIDRDYWTQGSVSTDPHGRVLIPGFQYMNRAFDGDLVAIRVWPQELWHEAASGLTPDVNEAMVAKQEPQSTLGDRILDGSESQFQAVDESFIPTIDQAIGPKDTSSSMSDQSGGIEFDRRQATGEVVGIVQQGNRVFCGSIEHTDRVEGFVLLLPANRRIPKIFIHSRQLQNLVNSRLLVRVDSWPITSHHPNGHITRIIGNIGDNEAETEMLLIEHDIKHDKWSIDVEKCLPPPEYEIDDNERAGRVDLRGVDICSIDPPGCTDIDDALHCVELPNGNYEVGVHIADVTHYMKPGSALDIEAAKRSTSVYLVDRRIDMIPARLSTNLCSLHEHVERLAFSTVWELSPEADIIDVKFFKSVILSRGAMTYAQAQERIDLEPEHCTTPELKALYEDKLTKPCKNLMKLARAIKAKRFAKGALSLASTEVKFKLNQDRTTAEDMGIYQLKEANSLVEEFMLLANVSVAEHTLRYFPLLALLRGHPTPPEEMLQPLVKAARSWGYSIDISNGKTITESLDGIQDPSNPMFNKIFRVLTTRCMTQAKYMYSGELNDLKQLHHFGLAAENYTHFTSPIRRYADCIVHRLLATSLGIHPLPEAIKDKAHMRDVVENLNFRHRQAQMASRASTDLWILKFFSGKDIVTEGLILAVKSTGFRLIVTDYGIECAIRLVPANLTKSVVTVHHLTTELNNSLTPPSGIFYNPELMTLTLNEAQFKVLQKVQIRICVKENAARRRWLHVELAGDSKATLTTDLISQLHHDASAGAIDLTPEILKQRQLEREQAKLTEDLQATANESSNSTEKYINSDDELSDEMFTPTPADQECAEPITKAKETASKPTKTNQQHTATRNDDDMQQTRKKQKTTAKRL